MTKFIQELVYQRTEEEEDLRDAEEALKALEQDPTTHDLEELKDEWLK